MENKENKLVGTAGALVGALAGGVAFFVLYQLNLFAAVTGTVGVILAINLYYKFAGAKSVYGVVISCVLSLVVILLAYFLAFGFEIYKYYHETYDVTFFDCLKIIPLYFEDAETSSSLIKDIFMAVVFWALGGVSTAVKEIKAIKAEKQFASNPTMDVQEGLNTTSEQAEENGENPLNK